MITIFQHCLVIVCNFRMMARCVLAMEIALVGLANVEQDGPEMIVVVKI